MNYNINLLNENEKRSPEALSFKSVARIGSIVVPIFVVFVFGIYFLNYLNLKQEIKSRNVEWSSLENKEKYADELAVQSTLSADILKEFKDWNSRGTRLYEILINLMVETPNDLYLKTLDIERTLELNSQNLLVCYYQIIIKGILYGKKSEARVINYKNLLENSIGFKKFVNTVSVEQYDENPDTPENLEDMIFTISIQSNRNVSK